MSKTGSSQNWYKKSHWSTLKVWSMYEHAEEDIQIANKHVKTAQRDWPSAKSKLNPPWDITTYL